MAKRSLPLSEVFKLIEPCPVILVTTQGAGRPNIMTMSSHRMVDFEPPTIACVMSNGDYSFAALKKTKECVINIPTVALAKQVVACSNTSGRDVDKFETLGFTPAPPLIAECFANLECKVIDTKLVTKYGLFILEVPHASIDRAQKRPRTIHHQGHGKFAVDGEFIRLRSRMK